MSGRAPDAAYHVPTEAGAPYICTSHQIPLALCGGDWSELRSEADVSGSVAANTAELAACGAFWTPTGLIVFDPSVLSFENRDSSTIN